jgi:hypothetical protein
VHERIVIGRRFRGPPNSAQGGYACGLVAEHVEGSCAAVSLQLPPPLERPLEMRWRDDDTVALLDGDRLIAEGASAELVLDVPGPVSLDQAERASADCPWVERHPFPGCFGCGPERSQDEAVAIAMGSVAGSEVFAAPWTPVADFADESGAVAARFVWAALDCPTAAPAVPPDSAACVLGRLTACLLAPVRPERIHTVVAWLVDHDGRKHRGAAAIHASDGQLCAYSEGLWIELRDPSAMGARS